MHLPDRCPCLGYRHSSFKGVSRASPHQAVRSQTGVPKGPQRTLHSLVRREVGVQATPKFPQSPERPYRKCHSCSARASGCSSEVSSEDRTCRGRAEECGQELGLPSPWLSPGAACGLAALQTSAAPPPAAPAFPFFPWGVDPPTGAVLWAWASGLPELLPPHSEEGRHGHSHGREQGGRFPAQGRPGHGQSP